MSLFSAVSADDIQTARIVTGVAMALFVGIGVVPGLRQYAGTMRMTLLVGYLLACAVFVGYVLLR